VGLDLDAEYSWSSVTSAEVAQALDACTDLLGQITYTAHGVFGDIYVEYDVCGRLNEAPYLGEPETVITVWTKTQIEGTKTLSIKVSFNDADTQGLVEQLFDAVDGYVGVPRGSRNWVL